MRMLVLGAGLQGSACAYDLLQDKQVEQVRLADLKINHLPHFLAPYSGRRLLPTPVDVRDEDAVRGLMRECDAVMSAIPYYFNFDMARLAVDARRHRAALDGAFGRVAALALQVELGAFAAAEAADGAVIVRH